ncbi:MAG: glycerate kinase [Actinomycetia bacterium]|nr:glycerate kinase [Actinomycetes bacterium]
MADPAGDSPPPSASPRSLGRVVIAFDKFRGTATANELTSVVERVAASAGWESTPLPMADGGEGSLAALGGPNKTTTVAGPLGDPVEAGWRLDRRVAYIEMAAASGLLLAGGAEDNDPGAADTIGTGQLIATAVELGARTIYVFLGGSATTDGGWGAVQAMPPAARLKEIDLVVATDVRTSFVDAAAVFGPQKGASGAQLAFLERRLQRLVQIYQDEYGTDVSAAPGAGAAGGLAGGLMALGGRIEPGFDVIAGRVGLDEHLQGANLVITGEGYLDDESFNGKVVGGVQAWAGEQSVPVLAIVGDADRDVAVPSGLEVIVLAEEYGLERALSNPVGLIEELVGARLASGTNS